MKIKIYRYIAGYGDAWSYDTDENPEYYREDKDWEFLGEYDLPEELIKEFPFYIE